ncbi:cytochrome o ubiquinol oxidase subunit IV [Cohnella nanjingensis]|uniref:Cytochrome o ubiquinol oxidase subunit IV n=1 Tax=Cohnella nanjingensis TaxID=1387779 RepID=A0A7X0VDP4_9BACL|nr:cytochrome o ubiquinol oxidase subunit IV [Cohnella nanjingensis]MBB6669896.1 cytochrome o ubiquinol oxidase subunit IV [Cohnella nanjingensis]
MAEQHPQSHGRDAHGGHDEHESHGSLKSYVIGFVLSLVLTAIPLIVVLNDMVTGTAANVVLLGTAVLQFVVQLFFFMHLKEEKKPRFNLLALILGLVIVMTIVAGSIWIMTYNSVG